VEKQMRTIGRQSVSVRQIGAKLTRRPDRRLTAATFGLVDFMHDVTGCIA
jgi:hypothetical protein